MSRQILFRNFDLLEPTFGEIRKGYELLVEGDTVKELSETPIKASEADIIDCGKRTLMPGLIDCHVHAIHSEVNVSFMEMLPLTLVTARAATRLRAMLDRGFTTVRDTGGADWGIKKAIETGHIVGRGSTSPASRSAPPGDIRTLAAAPTAAGNASAATG
jgi:imidazolonepropionase-like amidohydrolase